MQLNARMSERDEARLREWQRRLSAAEAAYGDELVKMDGREKVYAGEQERIPLFRTDGGRDVPHLRNVCCEMVENQIDSTIPRPKVTARKKENEDKARLIENMLRNKLDLLPFERINDLMERIVPIQGGAGYLVEWDPTVTTHETLGEIVVTPIHPKWIIPQDGVYTGIEDMDYVFLRFPQTKANAERVYGVTLGDEASEEDPEIRSAGDSSSADGLVTVYTAYYRSASGAIGKFTWCCDVILEDFEDYQVRRVKVCAQCGSPAEPGTVNAPSEELRETLGLFGDIPGGEDGEDGGEVCPFCGCRKFVSAAAESEKVYIPIALEGGRMIPGEHPELDEYGAEIMVPTEIPYYKPDRYPLILQKNVSVFGRFLGDSDIDKIWSAQNTINRIEKKIVDKLCCGGSYMTLPPKAAIEVSGEDMKVIRIESPAERESIGVYDMEASVAQDMAYLNAVYDEVKQAVGITDSYLGRTDSTATSGRAKQFSAQQAAGRLESKSVMKRAAYADLFELMFKFTLAYSDEPFPVLSKDADGNTVYDEFNRYEFLEQDEAGAWYWDDAYLFDCDTSSALATNREAMWQELRTNLQTGAFGDPSSTETLLLFWTAMEEQHYPGAGAIKKKFEERHDAEMRSAQMQQAAQIQSVPGEMQGAPGYPGGSI